LQFRRSKFGAPGDTCRVHNVRSNGHGCWVYDARSSGFDAAFTVAFSMTKCLGPHHDFDDFTRLTT